MPQIIYTPLLLHLKAPESKFESMLSGWCVKPLIRRGAHAPSGPFVKPINASCSEYLRATDNQYQTSVLIAMTGLRTMLSYAGSDWGPGWSHVSFGAMSAVTLNYGIRIQPAITLIYSAEYNSGITVNFPNDSRGQTTSIHGYTYTLELATSRNRFQVGLWQ